jgi:hypothetical protein
MHYYGRFVRRHSDTPSLRHSDTPTLSAIHNSRMVHRSLVGFFMLDQGTPKDDFKLLGFRIGLRARTPEVKKGSKRAKNR